MEKLVIAGRANWGRGFYIKFKAEERSMQIVKKIVGELGSEFFIDNQAIPKTFSRYSRWKDCWIPVYNPSNNELDMDIICGDKLIHMLVHKCPDIELLNSLFDKYCVWAEPRHKKSVKLRE